MAFLHSYPFCDTELNRYRTAVISTGGWELRRTVVVDVEIRIMFPHKKDIVLSKISNATATLRFNFPSGVQESYGGVETLRLPALPDLVDVLYDPCATACTE